MNTTTTALTDEQIIALTALLTAPGVAATPWTADSHEIYQAHPTNELLTGQWVGETCNVDLDDSGAANAALIVAAVNALPGLLDEIARLRSEYERFRGYIVDAGRITRDRATPAEDRIAELDEMFNG